MLMSRPAWVPTASRSSHHGNMGSLARLSPFGAPGAIKSPGIPMGHYSNGTTFRMDIHLWKRLGLIEAPIVFADAEIGNGKTSLAIVAVLNAALLAVEEDRTFKAMFEITRRNVGVAELSQLTKELNAVVRDMAEYGINIFDQQFGLKPGEMLDVVLECFNYIEHRDANTYEVVVLMAALRAFLSKCADDAVYAQKASNLHFEKCLATLTLEQVKDAIASHDEWEDDTEESASVDTDHGILMVEDIDLDADEFIKTRNACLLSIARLRKGEYGKVFSGKHSLAELFEPKALGVDYTGLNDVTIGLVQTLLWKFKRSAANSSDPERRKRFVFDWEIHDENRESWLHAPYRREVPRYLKRIRSVNCVMWFNLHRIPGDFETLPPEAREAALNAVREGTIFFHGHHDGPDARSTCQYFSYGERVRYTMQELLKGEFIFRVGRLSPQKVTIVLSSSQRKATFSEEASQAKTRVTPVLAALADRH